ENDKASSRQPNNQREQPQRKRNFVKTLKHHKKVTKKQASAPTVSVKAGRKTTLKRHAEVPALGARSKVIELDEPTAEELSKAATSVPRDVTPVEPPVERQPY